MKLWTLQKLRIWLKAKIRGDTLPQYFFKRRGAASSNIYIGQVADYKNWIFIEEEAIGLRGNWKSVYSLTKAPLDLEIGCGNGTFFEYITRKHPDRNFLGFEIKYKPLVQTMRRLKRLNRINAKGVRFNAKDLDHILNESEFHNVYIYFPDPWPKTRHEKNRLVRSRFLNKLFNLQAPGGFVEFKTDSENYFIFVTEEIKATSYILERYTKNLHRSEWATENFITAFERIFLNKNQPIYMMRLRKPTSTLS